MKPPGPELAPADPAFQAAWRLFRDLHDAPSVASAQNLVRWLGQNPRHARALDNALTWWALAGAALISAMPDRVSGPDGRPLQ